MKKLGRIITAILFLFVACEKKNTIDNLAPTEAISATTVAATMDAQYRNLPRITIGIQGR